MGLMSLSWPKAQRRPSQDLQAMKNRKEPYLPIRAGALPYAERLLSSKRPDDKLKATIAYLAAKGEFLTGEWLKENGIKGETKTGPLSKKQNYS